MARIRRRYSKQEKLEIVNESMETNIDFDTLASRYSLHPNTIRRWRSEFISNPATAFPGNGNKIQTESERELALLRKQLKESELANEILKKALGIISSPSRKNLHL